MSKRFLTVCAVLNGLLTLATLVLFVIHFLAPEWLEEMMAYLKSSDFDYRLVTGIIVCVNILFMVILFICNEVCYDQHCDIEEEKETPHESSGEVQYRTRLHFGRVKEEEKTDKGVPMKTKEERKAERLEKAEAARKAREARIAAREAKRAKKVEKAVEEKLDAVETKVEKHVDAAVDSFIKSLKK